MGVEDRMFTEFEGGGVMPNTVFPVDEPALTPSDKLRLMSITGQMTDSRATPDPGFWQGNNYFDPDSAPQPDRQRIERERQIKRNERLRYRESPR